MDLIDDAPPPQGNQPEYTVSELSGAVKRVIQKKTSGPLHID
jgi:exodeoxyribonuclease VII large subunit